jgi:hypothetical protein
VGVIKHVDLQIDISCYCIMGKCCNVYQYSRREGQSHYGSIAGHNVGHMPYVIVISLWVAYSFPYAIFIQLWTHWGNAYATASFHININKARHAPYKYSIRKQRLSINHFVAMSDMSNLHHNCNIWITPCIDKELLMALWPSMNTRREGSPLSLEFKIEC